MFGIRSVLVIPFADGIGDFINMQALLPAIQARFPDATVSVAASEHGAPLSNDPAVRVVKPAAFNNVPGKVMPRVRWLLPQAFVAWLAGPAWDRELGPFDLVINCFYAWERAMDFRRSWTPQIPAVPDVVHTIDCLAGELESALGVTIPPETRRPTLTLRPAAQAWAAEFLTAQELDPARPLVAFVPGTNMQIKRWPLERWTALDARLRAVAPDVQTIVFVDRPPDTSTIAAAFAAAELGGAAHLRAARPGGRAATALRRRGRRRHGPAAHGGGARRGLGRAVRADQPRRDRPV